MSHWYSHQLCLRVPVSILFQPWEFPYFKILPNLIEKNCCLNFLFIISNGHFLLGIYISSVWSVCVVCSLFSQVKTFLLKILLFILFIYFWLRWVFVAARGLSLVAVSSLLIAVASLAAEHELQARRLQQLWHAGSVVVAHGLSCSAACGIFLDQGLNLCPLHWQVDS